MNFLKPKMRPAVPSPVSPTPKLIGRKMLTFDWLSDPPPFVLSAFSELRLPILSAAIISYLQLVVLHSYSEILNFRLLPATLTKECEGAFVVVSFFFKGIY
jgi:hypothetical protein